MKQLWQIHVQKIVANTPTDLMDTQISRFMGPTWGPPGAVRTQVGPMLAPWTLLCGYALTRWCCQYPSLTTYSTAIYWKKLFILHKNNKVKYIACFTINRHWFGYWIGAEQATNLFCVYTHHTVIWTPLCSTAFSQNKIGQVLEHHSH